MVEADYPDDAESDSLTDAEAAVAQAESRAEQARARATRLRREADGGRGATTGPTHPLLALTPTTIGVGAALLIIAASLMASGYLVHRHLSLQREHQRAAEASAAARRGIEMMMSIDPAHARDNLVALVANTTGEFQSQLRATSTALIADAQNARSVTKATVHDVAVESIAGDSAVVLLVGQSDNAASDRSKRPPVFWRISVELARDDGRLKMSKVDFVQ